jgi:hypothetical protein
MNLDHAALCNCLAFVCACMPYLAVHGCMQLLWSGLHVADAHSVFGLPMAPAGRAAEHAAMVAVVHNAPGESVEWVNMCFRKIWRVYQRGLEGWITDLLQPVFDGLINVRGDPSRCL